MAHLSGDKVWIVWPPTQLNILAVRDHNFAIGPNRETRLDHWLNLLEDPKVFLIRKGDSYFLEASVIHACISLTPSAHYGVFCWQRKSLEVAVLNLDIMKKGYNELERRRKAQMKNRDKEDKKPIEEKDKANRKTLRDEEDDHYFVCHEFYTDTKEEWIESDSIAWAKIKSDGTSNELDSFIADMDEFMAKIE